MKKYKKDLYPDRYWSINDQPVTPGIKRLFYRDFHKNDKNFVKVEHQNLTLDGNFTDVEECVMD